MAHIVDIVKNWFAAKGHIDACKIIASKSKIAVVLEEGDYSGFIIYVDMNTNDITKMLKRKGAVSAFIDVIEDRIKANEYEDPGEQIASIREMRKTIGYVKNLKVIRAVIGIENTPVFNWHPK